MKRYLVEGIVLALQMAMFYLFPLTAGPTDAMGMVVLIILATLVLSYAVGAISGNRIKFLYPPVIAVCFVPSIFLYYNESALVHAVWYLVLSAVGVGLGDVLRLLIRAIVAKCKQ